LNIGQILCVSGNSCQRPITEMSRHIYRSDMTLRTVATYLGPAMDF
jgi:hypothetical protein